MSNIALMKGSSLLVATVLCFITCNAFGKKLYQYKDDDGHWNYTDKPPATEQEVKVRQLDVKAKQRIWLIKSGDSEQPYYAIQNDFAGPVEIMFTFSVRENVSAYPELPRKYVLGSGLSGKLFKINANSQQMPWRFSVDYKYTIGKPLDSYDSTYEYQPPFAPGQSFRISQAFNGSISHNDPYNQYAVDFSMPEGTAIHAAREGVVMAVESDFFRHGVDKKYLPEANSVRILHDDGSMAEYAHLELEKAVVFPGETVGKGQLIGYSGNTGFSSGPHLHFAIQYNKGMQLVSVPFSFTTSSGNRFLPEMNKTLQGF